MIAYYHRHCTRYVTCAGGLTKKCLYPWLLLAMRPVPILAEASAVFAGIGRMPAGAAALQLALGNAVVSMLYVFVGDQLSEMEGATWWAFLAAMAVSAVFVAIRSALSHR